MAWNPNATVTVAGVDFTGNVLAGMSIYYGRTTIWDQARSGYANVKILNASLVDNGFQINDDLVIKVEDTNGNDVTVFTGKVTDITNEVAASGSSATVAVQTLTAVGAFAQMSRTIVGTTNYPKEYDDDRINRILTEAGVSIDVVDSPGVYELVERQADPIDAYSLATYYAGMCFGYLYETPAGEVGYANESRRTIDVNANGYLDIDEGYINWRGIQSRKSIADIVNKVILFYKNNHQVTSDDAASISNYGLIEARIDTELHNMDEAQNIADRYVSLRSNPQTNFSSFNINLDNPNLLAADVNALIGIEMGTAIQIDNLPNPISPITYKGFVEGWSLQISQSQGLLTITTSDSTYSVVPIRWQDVDPTTQWDDLDPTAVKTTRTNLVTNPSLETAISGWNNFNANVSISQTTADAYIGTGCMQILSNVAASGAQGITNRLSPSDRFAAVSGDVIYIQARFKRGIGSRNARINLYGWSSATITTSTEIIVGATVTINSSNWTLIQFTGTLAGATTAFASVGLQMPNSGTTGDTIFVDAIIAEKNSGGYSPFYFDGSLTEMTAARRPELAWTGTTDRSASTAEAYFGTIPSLTWANVDSVGLP